MSPIIIITIWWQMVTLGYWPLMTLWYSIWSMKGFDNGRTYAHMHTWMLRHKYTFHSVYYYRNLTNRRRRMLKAKKQEKLSDLDGSKEFTYEKTSKWKLLSLQIKALYSCKFPKVVKFFNSCLYVTNKQKIIDSWNKFWGP